MREGETGFDRVLGFTLPHRNVRGRCVRLGPVAEQILSAHRYVPALQSLLSEALVLCTLIGSLLKGEGQLTMQIQAKDAPVRLLVCDFRGGELRGYVDADESEIALLGDELALSRLFGNGAYLAVTFDLETGADRYQGIVPLDGSSLSKACESYFRQSEQIPTLIRIASRMDGTSCAAGGILLQHLPHGEEGRERLHVRYDDPEWEHVEVVGASVRNDELASPDLGLEDLVWRLFHEEPEVRVEPMQEITRGCRCSLAHFAQVLSAFPENERSEMREPDGRIHVDCAFCSRKFAVEA